MTGDEFARGLRAILDDVERYRFLRACTLPEEIVVVGDTKDVYMLQGVQLDRALDEARGARK